MLHIPLKAFKNHGRAVLKEPRMQMGFPGAAGSKGSAVRAGFEGSLYSPRPMMFSAASWRIRGGFS